MAKRNTRAKAAPRISRTILRWLMICVIGIFAISSSLQWLAETKQAQDNAQDLLRLNISDVRDDILDASDNNLLELTRFIARDIKQSDDYTSSFLEVLAQRYDVAEINIVNGKGLITASTISDYIGFDMASGEQSSEFLVLLEGEKEYVQDYRPISYDMYTGRKYAGVALSDSSFVEVGYDSDRFQRDIDATVIGVTRNRHIGEYGSIIIVHEDGRIVSDRMGNEGKNYSVTGITRDLKTLEKGESFTATVYGEVCYCLHESSEGYSVFAIIPRSEVELSRNTSAFINTIMDILTLAVLFVLVIYLVRTLVVKNIDKINDYLAQISKGDLNVVVDVRPNEEFASLSDGINYTVDVLKHYIAEAAARIDTELRFAKAIQHAALPSVTLPNPNRYEFNIWADMHTAKEVGGDFYDFYFVNEETLAFLIADVSGKGIPAAMFMMSAKTHIKNCAEAGMDIDDVFDNANRRLCEGNEAKMFVTAWMGFVNLKTGLLNLVNAGHNPPLVRHKGGCFEYHKARSGIMLAMRSKQKYTKHELQLEPGDEVFLYTDGVTEATNEENAFYGEERLLNVLNGTQTDDAEALCRAVKADVDAFMGAASQYDDITMLSFKFIAKGNMEVVTR